ncbi:hypothetical protein GCM10029992_37660 [Glycomyces albus]
MKTFVRYLRWRLDVGKRRTATGLALVLAGNLLVIATLMLAAQTTSNATVLLLFAAPLVMVAGWVTALGGFQDPASGTIEVTLLAVGTAGLLIALTLADAASILSFICLVVLQLIACLVWVHWTGRQVLYDSVVVGSAGLPRDQWAVDAAGGRWRAADSGGATQPLTFFYASPDATGITTYQASTSRPWNRRGFARYSLQHVEPSPKVFTDLAAARPERSMVLTGELLDLDEGLRRVGAKHPSA